MMEDEMLNINDWDGESDDIQKLEQIQKPKVSKRSKEKSKDNVDHDLLLDLLTGAKTIKQLAKERKMMEDEIALSFKINIGVLNALLDLHIDTKELDINTVLSDYKEFWIVQARTHKHATDVESLDPHKRYLDWFKKCKKDDQFLYLSELRIIYENKD